MFLQRIHIWLAFCTEEGLLSVMFWQRIWIVQSGWPVDCFVQDFFPKHLYHPDGLAPSKGGGFVQIVFARNLYHGEWLFEKIFAQQLFCQPSSNDMDHSDVMACSKEERPVEFLQMIWIIWLGRPLPKRLFGHVICFIKEYFIPDYRI